MDREPAVAGMFYDATKEQLLKTIKKLLPKEPAEKINAIGVISPHAGYMYSGYVAAEVFSRVNIPQEVIIFCFNHHGAGSEFALWPPEGSWITPLGKVEVSKDLTQLIKDCYKEVEIDTRAHYAEHSAEVQIPFLQYFNPDIRISVIALTGGLFGDYVQKLKEFGSSLANTLRQHNRNALIVASTDMTHYEPQEVASKNDKMAIQQICKLDEDGLHQTIKKYKISMCGYAPTIAAISTCKALGAKEAILIKYQTSGDITRDYREVVGYAGLAFI